MDAVPKKCQKGPSCASVCVFGVVGKHICCVELPLLPFSIRPERKKARIVEIFIVFAIFVTLIMHIQFCLGLRQQDCTHLSEKMCVYV